MIKVKVFPIEKMWGLGTPEDLNNFLRIKSHENAVCFMGAIGLAHSEFRGDAVVQENQLVDGVGISEILKSKLIDVNENVDTFIHCWTPSVSTKYG